jgi:hypothetical protein
MKKKNHEGFCSVCGKSFYKVNTINTVCGFECHKEKNKGKKKPIPKKKKEYEGVNDLEVLGESALYDIIWEQNEGKSFLTGKTIPLRQHSSLYYNCFAHVLAKGLAKYPHFRLYSKNIILLSPDEHTLLDHSSADKRFLYGVNNNCKWTKIYDLAEELKEEYKKLTL